MGVPQGWIDAWHRSQPIDRCPTGAPAEVLRKIREHDSQLVLRWDPEQNDISVWRRHPDYSVPALQFFCAPYRLMPMVDNRLFLALVAGDRSKRRGRDEHDIGMRDLRARLDTQEALRLAASREKLEKIDHEKGLWVSQHLAAIEDGKPRGLFSQVPAQVEAT